MDVGPPRATPFAAAVRIVVEAQQPAAVERLAAEGAQALRTIEAPGCTVLGPAPPPVERVRGRVRRQILIKAHPPQALAPLAPVLQDLCQKQGVVVDHW